MEKPRHGLGDYDNDGQLDVLINNLDDAPVLLHQRNAPLPALAADPVHRDEEQRGDRSAPTLRAGDLGDAGDQVRLSYLSSNRSAGSFRPRLPPESRFAGGPLAERSHPRFENVRADQILTLEEGKAPAANARYPQSNVENQGAVYSSPGLGDRFVRQGRHFLEAGVVGRKPSTVKSSSLRVFCHTE